AVRRVAGHRPVLVHGTDIDDPATTALGDHLLGGKLRTEEGTLEVDVHHLRKLVFGGVEDGCAGLDAGVVDHDVHPPELFDCGIDEVPQVFDLAHVGLDTDGAITERHD